MHHLGHRQITELLTDLHQGVDDRFKFPQGLNLSSIHRHQSRIGHALGDGSPVPLASEKRIRTALDGRTVLALDGEKLFAERAASQFSQTGELLDKLVMLLLETGVISGRSFHIVV